MHPPLQPSSFLTTPHPSSLLQPLPPLYSSPLNPSSSFVTHRFTIFNFLLLILILFLLLQLSSPPANPLPPSSTSSSSATFLVSLVHPFSSSSCTSSSSSPLPLLLLSFHFSSPSSSAASSFSSPASYFFSFLPSLAFLSLPLLLPACLYVLFFSLLFLLLPSLHHPPFRLLQPIPSMHPPCLPPLQLSYFLYPFFFLLPSSCNLEFPLVHPLISLLLLLLLVFFTIVFHLLLLFLLLLPVPPPVAPHPSQSFLDSTFRPMPPPRVQSS